MGVGGIGNSHRAQLKRAAALFKSGGAAGRRGPSLFVFTDPVRLRDPLPYLGALPAGTALVYRHFGAPDRVAMAQRLAAACKQARLVFLLGADWRLAGQVGADGVHLPARLARQAVGVKRARPGWMVTVAAHSPRDLLASAGADLVILSPVAPTRSASARPVLGLGRAGALARRTMTPVIALGGVGPSQAAALRRAGFSGVAGVDWLLTMQNEEI
jgi:thiamine-phosphate pyrophosphorylase